MNDPTLFAIDVYMRIAATALESGDATLAHKLYKAALLEIAKAKLDEQSRSSKRQYLLRKLLEITVNSAIIALRLRKARKAECLLRCALVQSEKLSGVNTAQSAEIIVLLGEVVLIRGKHRAAEQYCRRALTIHHQLDRPMSPLFRTTLWRMAQVYAQQHNMRQADLLAQVALQHCRDISVANYHV